MIEILLSSFFNCLVEPNDVVQHVHVFTLLHEYVTVFLRTVQLPLAQLAVTRVELKINGFVFLTLINARLFGLSFFVFCTVLRKLIEQYRRHRFGVLKLLLVRRFYNLHLRLFGFLSAVYPLTLVLVFHSRRQLRGGTHAFRCRIFLSKIFQDTLLASLAF